MQHTIDKIIDVQAGGSELIKLTLGAGAEAVSLTMNWRLASELIDMISAQSDRIMAENAPQAAGLRAGAFRKCHTADAEIDITNTMMLISFDKDLPHRVAVAIPLSAAQGAGRRIEQLAKRAQKKDRRRTAQ